MKAVPDNIASLVGKVSDGQLRYVDCFVSGDVGVFMPVGGACFYALTPRHTHPSYMFVIDFDGQTRLRLGGRTISAEPGKVLALSPGVPHHELPSDLPPRYIAVMIRKEFFEGQIAHYPAGRGAAFTGESYEASPDLLPAVRRFMIEADNRAPGQEAVLHALGVGVCHSIIRGIYGLAPGRDRVSARMEVDRVVEHVQSNLDSRLTVGELAEVARMSPSHFARVFREETGTSPAEYVGRARMERAKKLLIAGGKSVTEIALECGFGSPAYLSSCFRKRFNITPSEFRKRLG